MAVRSLVRPVATPEDVAELMSAVAEPETAVTDPPLPVPSAAGALLLGLLLVASPSVPKEPGK